MSYAPQEIHKAIYSVLAGDSALSTLLGGSGKIFDRVPQEQAFPFITMGDVKTDDRGNHTTEGYKGSITVNLWYREPNAGRKQVQIIQNRIDQLIHKQDPNVVGWNVLSLRRGPQNIVIDPDNVTMHGIQVFNFLLGEK